MKLIRLIAALALCVSAQAQTYITVTAETNRVIRTNFTLGNAQVTGLSGLLDAKLATNGNGAGLTNLTAGNITGTVALASNITGILAISNGGTGSTSASNARTALGLGTAATNAATAFQPASTNLDLLANNNGAALTNLSATNFLPDYTGNDGKVLAVATGGTNIEWTAISNTVTDGSTITNIPAANLSGVVAVSNGGTGASNAATARVNLLPDYSNNATKVLALNSNATDVEWIVPAAGGGTSGVTSVDVSGGTTGLTTSGGPITNSGTITFGGTLAIASGGTGATNAAAAIESFLPAYTNNADKVLALNSNATALVWTTNAGGGGGSGTVTSIDASGGSTGMNFTGGPVTTNGTLTLGGTLAIGNGGTGAGDLTNARINLLPAYTNNAGKALVVNTNGTDIEWIAVPAVPVSIANGGTGATNTSGALINLSIINTNNGVLIGPSSSALSGVAIGNSARAVSTNGTDGANGVAVGGNAYSSTNGVSVGYNAGSVGGVAIGNGALTGAEAIAIGKNANAEPGIAIGSGADAYEVGAVALGDNAYSDNTNGIQIGTGTNSTANSVQFNTWGLVNSNQWAALANSTTFGHYVMAAPTNGTANQVLALNSNATAVVWSSAGSGTTDLSSTNVTGTLPIVRGGTGGTNALTALNALGVVMRDDSGDGSVILGYLATGGVQASGNVAIGNRVTNSTVSSGAGAIAFGYRATTSGGTTIAIGKDARAASASAVQIGTGTNSTGSTIQFLTAGAVDATEWGYLANASTQGGYAMTNTNGISGSKTFVAYDGTNYATNTVTFSNGIITGWTP
jgi:hypothetical protein